MREIRTSGSVGGWGGKPPWPTRHLQGSKVLLLRPGACCEATNPGPSRPWLELARVGKWSPWSRVLGAEFSAGSLALGLVPGLRVVVFDARA